MADVNLKDMVRGDSYGMTLTFKDKLKVPIDVEGRVMTFTMKNHWSQDDVDAKIQKIVDLVAPNPSAVLGQVYIVIPPEETNITPGRYLYDIQMVDGAIVTTLLRGHIIVLGDITLGT